MPKSMNKNIIEGLRVLIKSSLSKASGPSLAVSVASNGEIVWEEAFGLANIERNIPATPNTVYALASVTKPMTATALMILAQKGQVNLDAPVF
jgi:CubicO group peptidase (beta-lactamase class C family)